VSSTAESKARLSNLSHQVFSFSTTSGTSTYLTLYKKLIMAASSTAPADKSKPYFPLAGSATDGYSKEDEATATCFCGAVQLAFVSPTVNSSRRAKRPSTLLQATPLLLRIAH
jgi:hypothetical protein